MSGARRFTVRHVKVSIWRGLIVGAGVVALTLSACVPHHFELPAAERADAMPQTVTPAFVVTTPKGNWVAAGYPECNEPGYLTGNLRHALRSFGTAVVVVYFCKFSPWAIDIGDGPSHVGWGLSVIALVLLPDSLIVDDSVRAASLAGSVVKSIRAEPYLDWDKLETGTLQTREGRYQLIHLDYIWAALMVRGQMAYVVLTATEPKPGNAEFEVLSSLRPIQ